MKIGGVLADKGHYDNTYKDHTYYDFTYINKCKITKNRLYNWFYVQMALLIRVNKKLASLIAVQTS